MTQQRQRAWARFWGFGSVFAIVAGTGVVQVAVLVRVLGSRAWGEVAMAQSAAALTVAVAALGWSSVGASLIAANPPEARVRMFARSLAARAYAFAICAPILMLVVSQVATVNRPIAALVAFAGLIPVLGASWYFIGQGSPARLLILDTCPQVVGVLAGLALAMKFGMLGFACALVVGNLSSVALGVVGVRRDGPLALSSSERNLRGAAQFVREHNEAVLASWAGSVNSYLPTLVVALVAAVGLPHFALADRLQRYALGVFSPVLQFVQGWVPQGQQSIGRRARLALIPGVVGGLVASLLMAVFGGWVSRLISAGEVSLDAGLLAPFSIVVGLLMVGQVTALAVLIPLRMTRTLAVSTIAGTSLLLTAVFPAGFRWGASGVAWCMAACEVLAVSWQVRAVLRHTRWERVR